MTGLPARIGGGIRAFGTARWIITGLLAGLLVLGGILGLDIPGLASKSLWRVGMNLVLCLSLVPMIRGGTGLNFGLPIGAVAGLLAVVVVMEQNGTGFPAFLAACGLAVFVALPFGLLYGLSLNAVRGSEMLVGIYLGWACVAIFCVVWLVGPFSNPKLIWTVGGEGLRPSLVMTKTDSFGKILDDGFAGVEAGIFGEFRVYLGLFAAGVVLMVLVWLFFRTRTGLLIRAAGENPRFAAASGIRVNRSRIVAVTLATALAAIGTVIYSQAYGFAGLYWAPFYIALPAIAAVLIGGATLSRVTLGHVLIGVLLFQSILSVGPPVLTEAFGGGDITEALRTTLQNGMILYALTRRGGAR